MFLLFLFSHLLLWHCSTAGSIIKDSPNFKAATDQTGILNDTLKFQTSATLRGPAYLSDDGKIVALSPSLFEEDEGKENGTVFMNDSIPLLYLLKVTVDFKINYEMKRRFDDESTDALFIKIGNFDIERVRFLSGVEIKVETACFGNCLHASLNQRYSASVVIDESKEIERNDTLPSGNCYGYADLKLGAKQRLEVERIGSPQNLMRIAFLDLESKNTICELLFLDEIFESLFTSPISMELTAENRSPIDQHMILSISVWNFSPACDPPCQNGGTCLYKKGCHCSPGFSGSHCQLVIEAIAAASAASGEVGSKSKHFLTPEWFQVNYLKISIISASDLAQLASMKVSSQLMEANVPAFDETSSSNWETVGDILSECDHFSNMLLAPPNNGEPTKISVALGIDRLVGLDNVDESMAAVGTLFLKWNITTCPSKGVDEDSTQRIAIKTLDEVWHPRLRLVNSANADVFMQFSNFGDDVLAAVQEHEGEPNRTIQFFWFREGVFRTDCSLDLENFPFDTQTCLISLSLMRSEALMMFEEPQFFWANEKVSEWLYRSSRVFIRTQTYRNLPTSSVHFAVTLKRVPTFYLTNMVMPCFMLALLALVAFLLPPERPERPIFTVTVLLALCVAQTEVTKSLPRNVGSTVLSSYIFDLSLFCAVCTIYEMVACYLAHVINIAIAKTETVSTDPLRRQSIFRIPVELPQGTDKRLAIIKWLDVAIWLVAVVYFISIHLHEFYSAFFADNNLNP